jgi:GNAT superfamily N-acetyltransferase
MGLEKDDMEVMIREIELGDAQAAADLSAELGYPVDSVEMARRIEELKDTSGQAVFVACVAEAVIGWVDIGIVRHFSTGAHGEIGGFVVSAEHRSRGIGRALLARAEQWVAELHVETIIVRSRTTRQRAHHFYLREGYTHVKTSEVFSKSIELND